MSITLKYWNGRGLMEVPRTMLAIAGKFPGADYTDGRFDAPPADLEANLGRMPMCTVGDQHIGQSAAINHYIAAECGMLGDNNLQGAQIVAIAEHAKEMVKAWGTLVPWGTEPSAEAADKWFDGGATDTTGPADRAGYSTRFLTWWLGRMEAAVGAGGFAVGNRLSLADVMLYNALGEHLRESEVKEGTPQWKREAFGNKARTDAKVAQYPKIAAIIANVAGNANVQKWLDMRGVQGF
jgi:glutathione S-transferase